MAQLSAHCHKKNTRTEKDTKGFHVTYFESYNPLYGKRWWRYIVYHNTLQNLTVERCIFWQKCVPLLTTVIVNARCIFMSVFRDFFICY